MCFFARCSEKLERSVFELSFNFRISSFWPWCFWSALIILNYKTWVSHFFDFFWAYFRLFLAYKNMRSFWSQWNPGRKLTVIFDLAKVLQDFFLKASLLQTQVPGAHSWILCGCWTLRKCFLKLIPEKMWPWRHLLATATTRIHCVSRSSLNPRKPVRVFLKSSFGNCRNSICPIRLL